MLSLIRFVNFSKISVKLYTVAGLLVVAVLVLCASSLVLSNWMRSSTDELHSNFQSVDSLARLQGYIERHRRMTESAPAELDLEKLKTAKNDLRSVSSNIETLFAKNFQSKSQPAVSQNNQAIKQFEANLMEMLKIGFEVIGLAEKFAHDRAAILAQGIYDKTADAVQDYLNADRAMRIEQAKTSSDAVERISQASQIVAIASALIALLVLGPIGMIVTNRVVARLKLITDAMHRLVQNEINVSIPCQSDRDEIGDMAAALVVFKDNIVRIQSFTEEQELLKQRAAELRRLELDNLAASFEETIQQVVGSVTTSSEVMKHAAKAMSENAADTTERTLSVISQAGETAAQIDAVAAATIQLSGSIMGVAERASGAAHIARAVSDDSEIMHERLAKLVSSVGEIDTVVAAIGTIAAQTNLLALNATIEAARAGETGRGFAVVASEVKTLAGQTADATKNITAQIEAVQLATKEVVGFIGEFANKVRDISEAATLISETVREQQEGVNSISSAASQIAGATKEFSIAISLVKDGAETNARTAAKSHEAAVDLGMQAEDLNYSTGQFLTHIRHG